MTSRASSQSTGLLQEILIEALDTSVLFGVPLVDSVVGDFPVVQTDGMGGISLPYFPSTRFQYRAHSIPNHLLEEERLATSLNYPDSIRKHFLQLPTMSTRVTVTLPEDVFARAERLAVRAGRPVADVLAETIELSLRPLGGLCLLLRATISDRLAGALEGAVGVMLLLLGADVLWRLRRGRVHVHPHRHADGTLHLHAHSHAHSHAPGEAHDPHHHEHAHGLSRRALLVGLVHGLAGSAALLLVTVATISSLWLGLAYIAVFGIGSILGMAALSVVIALPLQGPSRLAGWSQGLEAVIGVSTILIGAWVLYKAY